MDVHVCGENQVELLNCFVDNGLNSLLIIKATFNKISLTNLENQWNINFF